MVTTRDSAGFGDFQALARMREQKAWYWYDWANSAFFTTTASVLFGPYLTVVAKKAVGCPTGDDAPVCHTDLHLLGLPISPGSLALYVITFSTLLSAVVLPLVGAHADRSPHKPVLLGRYAWVGSAFAALMFFVTTARHNWQLGSLLYVGATLCIAASLVVYDSILVDISTPDERDRVSSRGWAWGYVGGGLLLAINFVLLSLTDSSEMAVRVSLLSAGVWWAVFTVIPVRGLRSRMPAIETTERSLAAASFGQLWSTLKDLTRYPVTLTFLAAYLFYNDGIQTVIYAASIYAQEQLGFERSTALLAFLVVQIVAVGGALLFGRYAVRHGAKRAVLGGIALWAVVVVVGFFLPRGDFVLFLVLAIVIGVVLGGTQALSRSFYSQLVPRGREAEYFSLYQACERGTSWLGTLVFGLVHQWTDSYRPALLALLAFFLVGGALLARVDARKGIADAGNEAPVVV